MTFFQAANCEYEFLCNITPNKKQCILHNTAFRIAKPESKVQIEKEKKSHVKFF